MEFFLFLTLTAFAVSIDSMMVGFAIGLKTKKVLAFSICVSIATLVLCFSALFFGSIIDDSLGKSVQAIGSICLVFAGISNLSKKEDFASPISAKQYIVLSFSVGIDASIANLSLCLMGFCDLWIPLVFAVMHFSTVYIGAKLASTNVTKKLKHTNKISGLILILLGTAKLFA